jgi:membrane associated rhomboid family serine protease
VTWTLIAVNILLYLVELAHPSLASDWWMLGYAQYYTGGPFHGVAAGESYRLITSAFLPGTGSLGILDIAFNMWALYVVGPSLEQMLGRVRFLAVFGLFGAWFVASRKLGFDSRGIVLLIALNLGLSLVYRSTIAWQDHVGGLIVGAVVMAAYAYAPRKNRIAIQVAATVAVAVLLAIAVVIRNGQLTA